MPNSTHDVILIGGGVMGCSIAYNLLKQDPQLRVVIIEKDPTYEYASTLLSDGNHRVQFNLKENIEISLYGLKVIEGFATEFAVGDEKPDVAFRQQGNLFVVDESGLDEAQRGLALQRSLGCQVEWLNPDEISAVFPYYQPENIAGGTLGHQDGSMLPLAVLMGYRKKALSLGAEYLHDQVVGVMRSNLGVEGVALGSGNQLFAGAVVNTSGAWAAQVAQTAGIDLPILPIKRQVFVIQTPIAPEGVLPSLFFPSGLYVIHEGAGNFACGKSLASDPVGLDDFSWGKRDFEQFIWPELVESIPQFDRLKVAQGWSGLYAVNTLDGNAILGEWPELKGFFLANGFSGHGFQQCHAVGRYLAELILGLEPALDLSVFSPQRILSQIPIFESQHKLI